MLRDKKRKAKHVLCSTNTPARCTRRCLEPIHLHYLLSPTKQNRHPLNNRMEDMSATPTGKNRAEPISCLSILVNFISLQLCLTQSTDENTWVEKMKYKRIHPKRTKERKSRSRTFGLDNDYRDSRIQNSVFGICRDSCWSASGCFLPRWPALH